MQTYSSVHIGDWFHSAREAGRKVNVFSVLTLEKCHEKTPFVFTQSAICFKPSTCVVSKPVQVMSAVRELWSHVDLCKCKRSINNAVLSCVNYSIQGYANAHSAEQVRLRYSRTRRYWAKPSTCLANALQPTCSWLELGVRWHEESFSLIKMILIRGKINHAMGWLRVETCCLCTRLHRNILNNRVEIDWKYQGKEESVPLPVCLAAMLFGIWLTQTIFILLQNI